MGKLFILCTALALSDAYFTGAWAVSSVAVSSVANTTGATSEPHLNWKASYEEAKEEAKTSSKPIVLFFTGSDWCGWCHKLEKEVLNTPEFAELAGKEFLFVTVDFPLYKPADPKVSEFNKELQKKFDVKGFPTLVLIDKDEKRIGVTGYRPGGAKAYAEHLMKMVSDYSQYKQKVSAAHSQTTPLSSADLKSLFKQAKELARLEDAARLITLGLSSEDNGFFLLEKYRELAAQGPLSLQQEEAQNIKKKILLLDPNNEAHTHYELALIEFETLSEELAKDSYAPERAVEPLVKYIQKYGRKDKENVWRLQMIISQVYLDKNNLQQALDFARASYESAPDTIKSEIATAVRNLQTEIKK